MRTRPHPHRSLATRASLVCITQYQRLISPLFGPCCRYYPSCSEYAGEAIARWGVLRGVALTAWRLLRCHPFSRGGLDPVPCHSGEPGALLNKQS